MRLWQKRFLIAALGLSAIAVRAQKLVFTFDDLPAHGERPAEVTRLQIAQSILETLKRENMPPTYGFINGKRVDETPTTLDVLKAWRAAGQPLGNHTFAHGSIDDETAEQFEADVAGNEPLLKSLMAGEDWHYFRYPFLWEGDTLPKRNAVRAWLFAHNYKVAQVSMDFNDYLWNAPYARCVAQHDDKAISGLHDSYLATADQFLTLFRGLSKTLYGREIPYVLLMHIGAFDAKMLPDLIAFYRSKGFTFVSLEEAQRDPAYAADPGMPLRYGGTLQEQMVAKRRMKMPPSHLPEKELDAVCVVPKAAPEP